MRWKTRPSITPSHSDWNCRLHLSVESSLYLFSWKIAPALASGNCVVAKPSEVTPMTAFMLSEICIDAGLPKGVLNIVHGYGHKAGMAIVSHPKISAISFTGGTKTGETIARTAAPCLKNYHSNSEEKIRTSFLLIAILKEPVTLLFSPHSPTRVKFVCAAHEFLSKDRSMKNLKLHSSKLTKKLMTGDPLHE